MRNILGLLAIAGLMSTSLSANVSFGPKAFIGLGGDVGKSADNISNKLSGINFGFGAEALIESPQSTMLGTVGIEYTRRKSVSDVDTLTGGEIELKNIVPQIEIPLYFGGLFADQFVMMGGLIPRFGIGEIKEKREDSFGQKLETDIEFDESNLKNFGLGGGFRFGTLIPMQAGRLMPTFNLTFDIIDRNENDIGTDNSVRNLSFDVAVTYLF
jgi:hypothetical protein